MKVLLLSPLPPPVGGIQTWTENTIEYAQNIKTVDLMLLDTSLKFRELYQLSFGQRVKSGILSTFYILRTLRLTIENYNPDAIHLTSSASLALFKDLCIVIISKIYKVPLIIHWRFGRIPDLQKKNNWEWKLFSLVQRLIGFSIVIDKKSHETLTRSGFKNIAYVPNPIAPKLKKIALEIKNTSRTIFLGKVIFIGHVYKNKGVYELVKACVNSDYVKKLVLIGPVEEKVKIDLVKLTNKKKSADWLIFKGSCDQDEVFKELRDAQVFALPSYTEGFPNAILESLAHACPVVATNVGAIPEILDSEGNHKSGICVKKGEILSLKNAIDFLLSNSITSSEYGLNGVNRLLNEYTMERIFSEYESIWRTVIDNNTK